MGRTPQLGPIFQAHSAQQVLESLPKMSSSSRGPPSELPHGSRYLSLFLVTQMRHMGHIVPSRRSVLIASPSPSVEANRCLGNLILAYLLSDSAYLNDSFIQVPMASDGSMCPCPFCTSPCSMHAGRTFFSQYLRPLPESILRPQRAARPAGQKCWGVMSPVSNSLNQRPGEGGK